MKITMNLARFFLLSSIALTFLNSEISAKDCPIQKNHHKVKPIAYVADYMPRKANNIGPGSLITDAMVSQSKYYGVEIALLDNFSVLKDLNPGPLTITDIKNLVANSPLVLVDAKSKELVKIIELLASSSKKFINSSSPFSISGARFSLNVDANCNESVTQLEIGSLDRGYNNVEPNKVYRVITTVPVAVLLKASMGHNNKLRYNLLNTKIHDMVSQYISSYGKSLTRCTENRINITKASIAVFSDPHYFDPTLLVNNGSAFQAYLAQDRKLIAESHAILMSTVHNIRSLKPAICFITGDLTKDGELLSHESFAKIIKDSLVSAGIKTFVTPGNHDINNPESYSYDGPFVSKVPNVTSEAFTKIYNDLGFGSAIYRESSSLSYVSEPQNGLWVLSIDACKYNDNTDHSQTGGKLSPLTLKWIIEKLDYARARNITVLGLMHHGVTEHFTGQTQIMMNMFSDYVIDDWQGVRDSLAIHGLKTIFTGHYHAQDIVKHETPNGNFLYDIETGSSVTWPSPIRSITLSPERSLTISTIHNESIVYPIDGLSFQDYAHNYLQQGLTGMITYTLGQQFGVPAQQVQILAPAIVAAFCAHYQGDEQPGAAETAFYGQLKQSPNALTVSMGMAIETLWTDLAPADNNCVINLVNGQNK